MALKRVLVANRGEIAARIIGACQSLRLETVLATSEADRDGLPARLADRAVCVGPASAVESYLRPEKMVGAALATGCDALHPGYGFLSESPELASLCGENGVIFVGPKPDQIQRMGNKLEARGLAETVAVPTLPGSRKVANAEAAAEALATIGVPAMLKAAAGGGGRGMKIIERPEALREQFARASSEAIAAFGDGTLYLEKYIPNARHVEVQVLGDGAGTVIHLGERDCSLQRRHQKIIEEAPAPNLSGDLRAEIRAAAVRLAEGFGYQNAGTVEFIVDQDAGQFFFLEMNTRIQVEHPVTEMITGIDLVEQQLRIAGGETLGFGQNDILFRGHAVECRVNAENPEEGFRPSPGVITRWRPPGSPWIRLDTHCHEGYRVPVFYDSMIGKLIAYGPDRPTAVERMRRAIGRFEIGGIATTLSFQDALLARPDFEAGAMNTRLVDDIVASMREC